MQEPVKVQLVVTADDTGYQQLAAENAGMKATINAAVRRIAELEAELAETRTEKQSPPDPEKNGTAPEASEADTAKAGT